MPLTLPHSWALRTDAGGDLAGWFNLYHFNKLNNCHFDCFVYLADLNTSFFSSNTPIREFPKEPKA